MILLFLNVTINVVVIALCAWCLWSPLPRRFLHNGRTPILNMIRVFAIVLLLQAAVRIGVEVFDPNETVREVLRMVIGIISVGAAAMLVRFIRWVIEQALAEETHYT